MVYDSATRTMTWAGGGHPPAIVLLPGRSNPLLLAFSGPMMGVFRGVQFPAQSCEISAGARLLIFSDRVFEIFRDGRAWNLDACIAYLSTLTEQQGTLMDQLRDHVHHLRGTPRLDDDFSIIEARFK